MKTRKVFKTGHSIAITIPKNKGLSVGDAVVFDRVGETSSFILTKVVRNHISKTKGAD